MIYSLVALSLLVFPAPSASPVVPSPLAPRFDSVGAEGQAINDVLEKYTLAVSTKNKILFESILLGRDIEFSDVALVGSNAGTKEVRNYDSFQRDVFDGPAFTQRFEDIKIQQDGPLAQVSLIYLNTSSGGSNWGWKSLQLLKISGKWKIASEFYVGHPGAWQGARPG